MAPDNNPVYAAEHNEPYRLFSSGVVPPDPTATKEQRIDALVAIRQSVASASEQSEQGYMETD
jgi:hypothetical protein